MQAENSSTSSQDNWDSYYRPMGNKKVTRRAPGPLPYEVIEIELDSDSEGDSGNSDSDNFNVNVNKETGNLFNYTEQQQHQQQQQHNDNDDAKAKKRQEGRGPLHSAESIDDSDDDIVCLGVKNGKKRERLAEMVRGTYARIEHWDQQDDAWRNYGRRHNWNDDDKYMNNDGDVEEREQSVAEQQKWELDAEMARKTYERIEKWDKQDGIWRNEHLHNYDDHVDDDGRKRLVTKRRKQECDAEMARRTYERIGRWDQQDGTWRSEHFQNYNDDNDNDDDGSEQPALKKCTTSTIPETPSPLKPPSVQTSAAMPRLHEYVKNNQETFQEQEQFYRESAARLKAAQDERPQKVKDLFAEPIRDLSSLPSNHWELPNMYARLGLPHNSHFRLVKKHYWKLCLLYHPDKARFADAPSRFQGIKEAYESIKDWQELMI